MKTADDIADEIVAAYESGHLSEFSCLRDEYFNLMAAKLKRDNDLMGLNLLAALDESNKRGLHGASAHLSILVMIYLGGEKQFDNFCGDVYSPLDLVIVREMQRVVKMAEMEVDDGTADSVSSPR